MNHSVEFVHYSVESVDHSGKFVKEARDHGTQGQTLAQTESDGARHEMHLE